jgi:hypothetical protein
LFTRCTLRERAHLAVRIARKSKFGVRQRICWHLELREKMKATDVPEPIESGIAKSKMITMLSEIAAPLRQI